MKIQLDISRWGSAFHLGPFVEWQDWNVNRHEFTIGLEIGPWIIGLQVTIWDFFEEARKTVLPILMGRGMNEEEAWKFIEGIRQGLIAKLDGKVNLWSEVKKELGIK